MRVTNAMISNNMLLGLNKNMGKLNTLYEQMTTYNKIQRPSDDPIILGRSLKLRLNVLETEQYKTNVAEAKSWMDVSNTSIKNTHGILNEIRERCGQAANGTLELNDREKILTTIEQLKKQLIQEANANYAGRNVFGGYKTDKKVLFDKNTEMNPPVQFDQTFGKDDLETVTYREEEYYRIRLPYGDIDGATFTGIPGVPDDLIPETVESKDIPPDGTSYYYPEESTPGDLNATPPIDPHPGKAYFLKDTGELIVNKETYDKMMANNDLEIGVTYTKSEFKEGDPNPELFFESEDIVGGAQGDPEISYGKSKGPQKIEYEVGIGTKLDINVLGKDIFDPLSLRDIDELVHILGIYDSVEEDIKNEDPNGDPKEPTRIHKETINLSKLFSNGVGNMDKALQTVSGQEADLGSRMMRLNMTEERLREDTTTFTELLTRTENIDVEEVFINFSTQYTIYQSALQAASKVIQPTLMDFLR